jgi:hypothetical protein
VVIVVTIALNLAISQRAGAKPTTPNDDIGAADTTRAVPIDRSGTVVNNYGDSYVFV